MLGEREGGQKRKTVRAERRTPCSAMPARREGQSCREPERSTFHMSGCTMPWLIGEPAYDSYGPSALASSLLVLSAEK